MGPSWPHAVEAGDPNVVDLGCGPCFSQVPIGTPSFSETGPGSCGSFPHRH